MMRYIEGILRPREKKEVLQPERTLYLPNFDVVVFSGFAGTGKTSAADAVNEVIIGTQFVKVGQRMREEMSDLFNIPPEKDFDVDVEQERLMKESANSFPLILESRLGPVIGADIAARIQDNAPKIIRILVTADKYVRDRRVWQRDRVDNPSLTLEESIEETQRRDREFVARMQSLYPGLLNGQHPFDPSVKAVNGMPVYDIIIDTTFVPKDKVADLFIKTLSERNLLQKFQRADFGEGKAGDIAFAKIKRGSPCEYDNCNRLSKITIDSVTADSIFSHAVCSDAHALLLEGEITEDLKLAAEENPVFQHLPQVEFGRNGFAKSQSA